MSSINQLSIAQLLAFAEREAENDPVFRSQMDLIMNKQPGTRVDPYSLIESSLSEEERKHLEIDRKLNSEEYITDGLSIGVMHTKLLGLRDQVEEFQRKIETEGAVEIDAPIPTTSIIPSAVITALGRRSIRMANDKLIEEFAHLGAK